MAGLERILWYLNFIATLAVLVRLVQSKLWRSYPSLFLFWLVQAAEFPVMYRIPLKSVLYARYYYGAQTISLILAIFVVLELYREALARHPALAGFGRRSVVLFVGAAALMAALGVVLDITVLPGQSPSDHRFLTLERTVDLMILAFLLLISGFLLWFPVRVKRNVAVYITGFVLFYCSRSVGILLVNLLPSAALQPMSIIVLALTLGCLIFWLAGLRKESKDAITVTGNPAHGAALERLSAQLDQINTAVARFARNSS
jgi:hypothetical protein